MAIETVPEWMAGLEDEDLVFIKKFVLASGSLKEMAGEYGVGQLVRICSRLKAKLNLIPYNPTPGSPYAPPSPESLLAFERMLWNKNITAIVRKSKGQDIEAACGQLRAALDAAGTGTPGTDSI